MTTHYYRRLETFSSIKIFPIDHNIKVVVLAVISFDRGLKSNLNVPKQPKFLPLTKQS